MAAWLLMAGTATAVPWQNLYSSSGYIWYEEIYDENNNVVDADGITETHVITVPQAGTIRISTTGSTDTRGYISSGTTGYEASGGGSGGNFVLTLNVPAGTYDVNVSGQDDWVQGNYGILVEFKPGTTPPTASFTMTPTFGKTPLTVQLTATANDPDGQVTAYEWDFNGDDVPDATGASISRVFTNISGIRLLVKDNDEAVGRSANTVWVYPANYSAVTVENGTRATGWPYDFLGQGHSVSIQAVPPPGQVFSNWSVVSGAGTFQSASSASTYFSMGNAGDTVIRANTVPDTTAPSTPTNVGLTGFGARWALLTWTASTDNLTVTGYEVLHNGTVLATSTGTTVAVPQLSPNTTYQLVVKARDYAGNRSNASSTVSVTTQAVEGPTSTQVYNSAPTSAGYTVPAGTKSIVIKAWGSGGAGSATSTGGAGGALVVSYLLSATGQTLYVYPAKGGQAGGGAGQSYISWQQEPNSTYTELFQTFGGSGNAGGGGGGAGSAIRFDTNLMVAAGGGGAGSAPNASGGAAGAAPLASGVIGTAVAPQSGGPGYGNSGGGAASLQNETVVINRQLSSGSWWLYTGPGVVARGGSGGAGNGYDNTESETVGTGEPGYNRSFSVPWTLSTITANSSWQIEGPGSGGNAGEAGDTSPAFGGGGGGGGLAGGGGGGTGDSVGGGGGGGGLTGFSLYGMSNVDLSYVIVASGSGQTPPLTSDPSYPGGQVGRGGDISSHGGNGAVVIQAYGAGPAPALNAIAAQNIAQGAAVSLTAVATSIVDDPVRFSAVNLPPGVSINETTGVLSGTATAAGVFNSTIKATTVYGRDTKAVVWTVVDGDKPSKPAGLKATTVAQTTFNLVWTASTDNIGVTGYDVKINGTSLGVATGTSRAITATLNGPTYTMEVRARDAAGNWSDWSDPFLMKPYTLTVNGGTPATTSVYAGVVVDLNANIAAFGQYFGGWTLSGPGSFDFQSSAKAKFTLGAGDATLTATYTAGVQLNTNIPATADAGGGEPGRPITIRAMAAPTGYTFLGWEMTGPGYIEDTAALTTTARLGDGNMWAGAFYWDNSTPRPPIVDVGGNSNVATNTLFPITSAAICVGAQFHWQQLDYSTDGGKTWVEGTVGNGTRWEGTSAWNYIPPPPELPSASQNTLTKNFSFSTPGVYLFRTRAGKSNGQYSVAAYKRVNVGMPASIPYTPVNLRTTSMAGNTVNMAWDLSFDPGFALSYEFFGTPPGNVLFNIIAAQNRTVALGGLTPGLLYKYKVRVTDWGDNVSNWSNELDVTLPGPATIVTQPINQSVHEGANVTFAVLAGGSQPFSYQWYKGAGNPGEMIPGATSSSLTLSNVTAADANSYRVKVTNYPDGVTPASVMSNSVTLSVNRRPVIGWTVSPPSGLSPLAVTFSAAGTSDPDGTIVAYSWSFGDGSSNETGVTTSHTYQPGSGSGTFNAVLTVTDNQGATSTATQVITVGGGPTDTDNDGIPNDVDLNPNSAADALLDHDGDGLTNLAEYNLGTSLTGFNAGTSSLGNTIPAGWPNAGDATNTRVVGLTAGELSVDKSGAATYSIPIWASPGTAGMQPKLSLNYSSQAGSGIAGFGWSLGGASAISRGPQTKAVDAQIKGVAIAATDRFYLDGQRLIYVGGGAGYGTDGAEYRTEIESFTKVVSYGTRGSGPAWFKAWTKAGLIIEFGNTTDAAFDAYGKTEALNWSVNRISDTKGNYLTFIYTEDAANGKHQLARIDYTGNTGASLSPFASVRFEYENRPDWSSGYLAGVPLASLQRLKYVKSYVGETVVRTYTLGYTQRAPSDRSLLTSLTETGNDGKSYPDLTFEYDAAQNGWQPTWEWKPGSDFAPPYVLADNTTEKPTGAGFIDLNGDGRTDFVYRKDSLSNAYLNDGNRWDSATGQGYLLPQPLAFANGVDTGARFADLNGDGLPDFIWRRHDSGDVQLEAGVRLNSGTGWTTLGSYGAPAPIARDNLPLHGAKFLDIDGDGRIDFVGHLKPSGAPDNHLYVYLNTGTGWSTLNTGYSALPGGYDIAAYRGRFIDVNGDGLPDIVVYFHGSGTTKQNTWLNTGSGWEAVSAGTGSYVLPQLIADDVNVSIGSEFADVNSDGLPDLVWYREKSGTYEKGVALNTGVGWNNLVQGTDAYDRYAPPAPLSRDGENSSGAAMLDLNSDGLVDMAMNRQFTGQTVSIGTWYGDARAWAPQGSSAPHDLPVGLLESGVKNSGIDFVDLDADGAVDLVYRRKNANGSEVTGAWHNRAKPADRLTKVTNGFGVKAQIAYQPLTESTVYTKGTGAVFPKVEIVAPMQVVAQVKHDDGTGGTYDINYKYGGLRAHADRGSLGFESMRVTDSRTAIESTTTFSQDYPFIGMPKTSITRLGVVKLSESVVTYDEKVASGVHFPFAKETLASSWDLSTAGAGVFTSSTNTYVSNPAADIDAYGNILRLGVDSLDAAGSFTGFRKVTVSTYDNDTTNWFLGRLTRSTVTADAHGKPTLTRVSAFVYNPTSGLLTQEIIEPDDNTFKLTTTYGYDAFGNIDSTTLSGQGVTSRTTSTPYTTNGRFPYTSTNALNHTETYTYDPQRGVLTELKGPNGLVTSWEYNGFGQKTKETRADGTISKTTLKWAGTEALVPPGAKYLVETESTGTAPALVFNDALGRGFLSLAINGSGEIVYQKTTFDSQGRAYASSVPYRNDGSTVYWTRTSEFDALNRPKTVITPDDENGEATTTFVYNGLTTEATDAKGRVTRTVKNSQGWVTQIIRNYTAASNALDRSEVTYEHDALGNVTSTDAAGSIVTVKYNKRGQKYEMTDPDMGFWEYGYNVFGELTSQTNAKLQTVTLGYDLLGRMTSRIENEGTTTWTYDTAQHANPPVGAPSTWVGYLGSVTSPGGYTESHTYDSLGRPAGVTRSIDSVPYTMTQTYDSVGRPEKTIYPTGFQTRNVYNDFGFLKEVRRADNGKSDVYWMADSYSVTGKVDTIIHGNGLETTLKYRDATGRLRYVASEAGRNSLTGPYTVQHLHYEYDHMGNVETRTDGPTNRSESFQYDGLDRLVYHARTGAPTVTVAYNQKGNITFKSDVGTYIYGGSKPHAVTQIGSNAYVYDANGNMESGGDRTLTWTSFNQLLSAAKGGITTAFAFGAAHERVKQTSNGTTTIYVGGAFEKVSVGSAWEHKHYIMGPTGRIAVHTERSNATTDVRYFHTDGLGSITAVSDERGQVVKRFAFDAWGKRVDPVTNNATNSGNNAGFTRGYTDHEHLDDVGLVHMNGRVYDPVLGRFLSADPNVGDPSDAQDYNRYSYVGNNPLGATDPSGYFSLKDGLKIVAAVVVGVVTAGAGLMAYGAIVGGSFVGGFAGAISSIGLAAGWGGGWAIAAGAGFGFGSAFATSLLNGGSLGHAFKAGAIGSLVGGISAGIAGKIGDFAQGHEWFQGAGQHLAHGGLQGGLTEATGGEFRHGFYAGFAGSAAGGPLQETVPDSMSGRTAAAAVIGGTASAVGGGKFANGAVSAAFTHLFNSEGHAMMKGMFQQVSGHQGGAEAMYAAQYKAATGLEPGGWIIKQSMDTMAAAYIDTIVVPGSVELGGIGTLRALFSAPALGRIFWSGGSVAKDASVARAAATGGKTLEMTMGGKIMTWLTNKFTWPIMKPVWYRASSYWARGAEGTVDFVQNTARPIRADSAWLTVERPILQQQGNPINVIKVSPP